MADIEDGESVEVKGSGSRHYTLRNVGGAFSCSCPAWRNQGVATERRTCKHLKKYRGVDAEKERLGDDFVPARRTKAQGKDGPPLLLAERWDNHADLTGWWMSEKLDGVRAYWTGERFLSRLGNVFHAPDWFIEGLPADTKLDGELWIGRQQFQRTVSVVRRQDKSEHWKELSYVVFDTPAGAAPFEERMSDLREIAEQSQCSYLSVLEHDECEGLEHMQAKLAEVENAGGEGLMLREPGSKYTVGRSGTLLKVKTFHDAEAIVTGYVAGKGRHKGSTGALEAELLDGTCFAVGTGLSDAERRNPPPVGSVITFRYQELSNAGVPRFPSYVGIRDDVEWTGRVPQAAAEEPSASEEPAEASSTANLSRYFELVAGKSAKFWEVTISGNEHTVRYGRIGTNGQSRTKSLADAEAARSSAAKLIAAKIGKGYDEIGR